MVTRARSPLPVDRVTRHLGTDPSIEGPPAAQVADEPRARPLRAAPSGASEAREHLPLLDVLRIVASLAVVHHHMRSGFLLGIGFGVPLFLMIMFGLSCGGSRPEPLGRFARRKAHFLLVPWLRWSLIYVAVLVLGDLARDRAPFGRLQLEMLGTGGHLALWFLPFAAVAVIAARGLLGCVARVPIHVAMLSAALLAVGSTEVMAYATSFDLPQLSRMWLRSSPGILWGLAFASSLRMPVRSRRGWLAAVALVSTLAFLVSPTAHDVDSISRRYAVAVPLVCLGFAWRPPIPSFVPTLAGLCFGVYLVHSLVGQALWHLFDVTRWPAALHTGLAWCLSAILVAGLRRAGVPWHELRAPERATRGGVDGRAPTLHEPAQADRRAA